MSIIDRFKESAGTGATILGFVGVIGSVAVYGTNLKNQFDASQTKIVQLETEVATLRDQLDKSYNTSTGTARGPKGDKGERGERGEQGLKGERGDSGQDANPARIIELERRVGELAALIASNRSGATASSSANFVATLPASSDFKRRISDLGFEGFSTDGMTEWPFVARNVRFTDDTHFVGEIEWMSLNAINKIEGTLYKGTLRFKETRKIKRGRASTGCEYSIENTVGETLQGTYAGCASGGSIRISLK